MMMRRLAAIVARKGVRLWACEIAGVIGIAFAMWAVFWPMGILVAGVYLVLVANTGGDDASG